MPLNGLVAYTAAVIANLVNHPERGAPTTDNNREEFIRTKAFLHSVQVVQRAARMRIGTGRLN
jgi:hypothetical protein